MTDVGLFRKCERSDLTPTQTTDFTSYVMSEPLSVHW